MTYELNSSNRTSNTNYSYKCYFLYTVIFDKENKGLFYSSITTIVINGILALCASLGNTIFILTLWKTNSIRTPSNKLLGNLALSDLLVGLIVQPLYVGYKVGEVRGSYSCLVHISFSTSAWIAVGVSFLTLTAISLERYMAICKSFFYLSLVQGKTVLIVSAFVWILTLSLVFSRFWGLTSFYFYVICLLFILVSFITTAAIYIKIYRVAKQHHRSIRDQSQAINKNMGNNSETFAKETKLTKTVGLITGLFFLCYLPTLGIMVYYSIKGYSTNVKTFYAWTDTIVFLNSSLNPVVYYLRNTNIRQAVVRLLWQLKSCKNPVLYLKDTQN